MKIQYKHQKFQRDAAQAVVDVFTGQPYGTPSYMMDRGYEGRMTGSSQTFAQASLTEDTDFTGWNNMKIIPELTDSVILEQIQKIQRNNQIKQSDKLEGR